MNSRRVLAIVRKDMMQYLASPMGYIVLAVFFHQLGNFFAIILIQVRQAIMAPMFQNNVFLLLFITPLITMRLWSEEEKSGTAELLKTSSLTLGEIVFGKYLAICCFFGAMLSVTFVYFFIMVSLGSPDWGIIFANYIGYVLAGMVFFSLGLLASTLSENQIVSAVIAYGMLLTL